jgi:hypothetical protein
VVRPDATTAADLRGASGIALDESCGAFAVAMVREAANLFFELACSFELVIDSARRRRNVDPRSTS